MIISMHKNKSLSENTTMGKTNQEHAIFNKLQALSQVPAQKRHAQNDMSVSQQLLCLYE